MREQAIMEAVVGADVRSVVGLNSFLLITNSIQLIQDLSRLYKPR